MEHLGLLTMMILSCLIQTYMSSVSTFNSTYNNYYSNSNIGTFSVTEMYSAWDLGILNVGEVITFEFTLPNTNTSGPNLNFNYLP